MQCEMGRICCLYRHILTPNQAHRIPTLGSLKSRRCFDGGPFRNTSLNLVNGLPTTTTLRTAPFPLIDEEIVFDVRFTCSSVDLSQSLLKQKPHREYWRGLFCVEASFAWFARIGLESYLF